MILYLLCKHTKLKTLITRLAFANYNIRVKQLMPLPLKKNHISEDIDCTCKLEWWSIIMLPILMLGVTEFFILKSTDLEYIRSIYTPILLYLMLFMLDIYRYVWIQISNVLGDITLFKLIGVLNTNSVILRKTISGIH